MNKARRNAIEIAGSTAMMLGVIFLLYVAQWVPHSGSCLVFAIGLVLTFFLIYWSVRTYALTHKRLVLNSIVEDQSTRESLLQRNVYVGVFSIFAASALTASFGAYMLEPGSNSLLSVVVAVMLYLVIFRLVRYLVGYHSREQSRDYVVHIISAAAALVILSILSMAQMYGQIAGYQSIGSGSLVDHVKESVTYGCDTLQHLARTFSYINHVFLEASNAAAVSPIYVTILLAFAKSFLPISALILAARTVDDVSAVLVEVADRRIMQKRA